MNKNQTFGVRSVASPQNIFDSFKNWYKIYL